MGGGPLGGARVGGVPGMEVDDEGGCGVGVAVGGGVFVELSGVAVQATVPGGISECDQVGGVGVGGGRGPEVNGGMVSARWWRPCWSR